VPRIAFDQRARVLQIKPMSTGYRLATILGFPVRLKASFLIMLGMVFLWMGGLAGVAGALLAFGSVLLHELGHAVVARRLGVGVADIELHFYGGAARLTSLPRTARDEMVIAAAGPAVSFALAGLGLGLAALTGVQVFVLFGWVNLVLGGFNLIPAFPSDGGRILRAWLARRAGLLAATDMAIKVGRVACVGLAVLGVYWGQYQLAILAAVLWMMGTAERVAVRLRGQDPWRTGPSSWRTTPAQEPAEVEYIPPGRVEADFRRPSPGPRRVVVWRF
jgi:Zn-dependent protease